MPKRAGKMYPAGNFDLSVAPKGYDPRLRQIILQDALSSGTPLDKMYDRMSRQIAAAIASIKRDIGLSVTTTAAPALPTTVPVVASKPKNRRSEGAMTAWETRREIDKYMETHPGISRDDARSEVKALHPERTRTTADGPRDQRGQKAWDTRVSNEMAAAAERGEPITREQAHDIVAKKMRGKRPARQTKPAAAKPARAVAAKRRPARVIAAKVPAPSEEKQAA